VASNVNDVIKTLGPAQRKRVDTRADKLVVEQMKIRPAEKAQKLPKQSVSESPRIGGHDVLTVESAADADLYAPIRSMRRSLRNVGSFLILA
jgi:hypothetical protein